MILYVHYPLGCPIALFQTTKNMVFEEKNTENSSLSVSISSKFQ